VASVGLRVSVVAGGGVSDGSKHLVCIKHSKQAMAFSHQTRDESQIHFKKSFIWKDFGCWTGISVHKQHPTADYQLVTRSH